MKIPPGLLAPSRTSLLGAWLLFAGCSAPSLDLEFSIDDPELTERIGRYAVEVYRPAGAYDCDALAFGRVQPIPIFEARFLTTVPELGVVPRTGEKLFVLRGLAAESEQAIVVGCAELGDITEDIRLVVAGEPVTTTSLESDGSGLNVEPGAARDNERWPVEVVDALGRTRLDIAARWSAFGSGMDQALEGTAVRDGDALVVRLPGPPAPGPLRLTVRSRWSEREAVTNAWVAPQQLDVSLSGPGRSFLVTRSDEGQTAVLTTEAALTGETQLVRIRLDPDAVRTESVLLTGPWLLGHTSAGPFLLSTGQFRTVHESGEDLAVGAAQPFSSPFPGEMAYETLNFSGCEPAEPDPLVLVRYDDLGSVFFDANFVQQTDRTVEPFIEASGCVTTDAPAAVRATWVAPLNGGELKAWQGRTDVRVAVDSRIVGLSFGGQRAGGRPVALTTSVIGEDTQISVNTLRFGAESDPELVAERTESLLGLPFSLDVGDVDGNGKLDIAAVTRVNATQFALYVVVAGDSSTAAAGQLLPSHLSDPWIAVADFDDDGRDDIVVGERQEQSTSEARTVFFFRMGRAR